jgi:enoyl-CoA hydratase
MPYEYMLFEVKDGIALVTFNRPDALNALSPELVEEFADILDRIAQDETAAVAVLTGTGKAFVSGADIKAMKEFTSFEVRQYVSRVHDILFKIESLPQPVIAAVNGFCLGGGNEIALACDFVYASEKARFGQPEINLGIIPGFGGTQRLPRLVGKSLAKELCMTGEMLMGDDVLRVGLANKIFPADRLMEETMKTAGIIASKGRLSVRTVKQLIDRGAQIDLRAASALETEAFTTVFSSDDAQEGLAAFIEKRDPEFKGTFNG